MEDCIELCVKIIGAIAVVCIFACLGGFIVWALYPHIHALFPNASAKGIIAESLGLWDSICIVWIFSILTKSYRSIKK